ncbi:hypothetical protein AB1Y20_014183 [Prymnesium parvum]|uniref:J domain-containing protein n=1 Tax=Prymnesium parvum TaxID=97485 RepID=A0AB34IGZ4_PRYPA
MTAPSDAELPAEAEAVLSHASDLVRTDEAAAAHAVRAAAESLSSHGQQAAAAQLLLRGTRLMRRQRALDAGLGMLDEALRLIPNYTAALFERALLLLDMQRAADARAALAQLVSRARAYPRASEWLTFACAQEVRAQLSRPRAVETAAHDGCQVVFVGPSASPTKVVRLPPLVGREGGALRACPPRVHRHNWLGGHEYDDEFAATVEEGSVTVARVDLLGEGWGLPLHFFCCAEAEALERMENETAAARLAEAEAAPWRTDDHYAVLGVPCDFTMAELKRNYRSLSLRYHPDRTGGSDVAFVRIAKAYECLSDDACRRAFDAGEALSHHAPPWMYGGNDPGMPFSEKVERHFFKERFPFLPFGDPLDNHPAMREKVRQEDKAAREAAAKASSPELKSEL